MDSLLEVLSLPFCQAFDQKKKLTLSAESKKYLLCLWLLFPDSPSKIVICSFVGSNPSTSLSISSIAYSHFAPEMKLGMRAYPFFWRNCAALAIQRTFIFQINLLLYSKLHILRQYKEREYCLQIYYILQKRMLKYYVSKNYRKTYDSLSQMGLLSQCYAISYSTYQSYAKQLTPQLIPQNLQILISDKLTPIQVIKALLLVHAILQANSTLQSYDLFYAFMNQILSTSQAMADKIQSTVRNAERVRAKSAVFTGDLMRNEQIEQSKQKFLLQKVVKPYVLYLQRAISVFALYSLLSKTLYRTLVTAEVWILLNLFKYANSVTINLTTIYSFKRKSFSPVAQGLAQAFSTDFNNFYPKLNRFIHEECNRIEIRFNESVRQFGEMQTFKRGVQGLEDAVNVLQEVGELNDKLKSFYGESGHRKMIDICSPKWIQLGDEQLQFVLQLHKMKNSPDLGTQQTPKFYRTTLKSNQTEQTEQNKEQGKVQLVPIFREITNGQQFLCTFRKEKVGDRQMHIPPRYKRQQQN